MTDDTRQQNQTQSNGMSIDYSKVSISQQQAKANLLKAVGGNNNLTSQQQQAKSNLISAVTQAPRSSTGSGGGGGSTQVINQPLSEVLTPPVTPLSQYLPKETPRVSNTITNQLQTKSTIQNIQPLYQEPKLERPSSVITTLKSEPGEGYVEPYIKSDQFNRRQSLRKDVSEYPEYKKAGLSPYLIMSPGLAFEEFFKTKGSPVLNRRQLESEQLYSEQSQKVSEAEALARLRITSGADYETSVKEYQTSVEEANKALNQFEFPSGSSSLPKVFQSPNQFGINTSPYIPASETERQFYQATIYSPEFKLLEKGFKQEEKELAFQEFGTRFLVPIGIATLSSVQPEIAKGGKALAFGEDIKISENLNQLSQQGFKFGENRINFNEPFSIIKGSRTYENLRQDITILVPKIIKSEEGFIAPLGSYEITTTGFIKPEGVGVQKPLIIESYQSGALGSKGLTLESGTENIFATIGKGTIEPQFETFGFQYAKKSFANDLTLPKDLSKNIYNQFKANAKYLTGEEYTSKAFFGITKDYGLSPDKTFQLLKTKSGRLTDIDLFLTQTEESGLNLKGFRAGADIKDITLTKVYSPPSKSNNLIFKGKGSTDLLTSFIQQSSQTTALSFSKSTIQEFKTILKPELDLGTKGISQSIYTGLGAYERFSPSMNIPYGNINVLYPKNKGDRAGGGLSGGMFGELDLSKGGLIQGSPLKGKGKEMDVFSPGRFDTGSLDRGSQGARSRLIQGTGLVSPQAFNINTSQKQISGFGFSGFNFSPTPLSGFSTGFGGFGDFNFNHQLGGEETSRRKKKGKRKKQKIRPSFTAEVFNLRGALPKESSYGVNPFRLRSIPRNLKFSF